MATSQTAVRHTAHASLTDHAVAAAREGRQEGLDAWVAGAGESPLAMLVNALRTDAPVLVDGLARAATSGALSMGELAAHVDAAGSLDEVLAPTTAGPGVDDLSPAQRERGIASVACVAAYWCGRALDEASTGRGLRLFEAVLEVHGVDAVPESVRAIPMQQALLSDRPDLARRWVDLPGAREDIVHGVRVDLARDGDPEAWLAAFNGPFTQTGCTPITLTGEGDTPYDRMEAALPHLVEDGPLVTVLMPCWRPDEGLITSVRSIINQTWRPLEILVLDDASGPESDELFARVEAMDERITVVRMPVNGGSYVARNHGISLCHGEFVTVQDADDWSHPERIERHVRDLQAHPEAPANRSRAIRVKDDLTHQWLGYPTHRRNASSLMVRREVFTQAGGFQAVRKGADSEYHFRLDALGHPVRDIGDYLAVIRLSMGSLSRGDFMWHRNNPDRLVYRGVYAAWHRALRKQGGGKGARARRLAAVSGIDDSSTLPFWVPRAWNRDLPAADGGHFPSSDEEVTHEWVLRGDFSQGRRVEQLKEFLAAGIRPVLWHQERALPISEKRRELAAAVGDLIVAEQLRYVSANERTRARNLVVLDLGLSSRDPGSVRADVVWVDADGISEDGGAAALDLLAVPGQLREAFGTQPQWVTRQDPARCGIDEARPAPWLD